MNNNLDNPSFVIKSYTIIMHEHLLSIAEKIIQNSAPYDISEKYFKLKNEILRKYLSNSIEGKPLKDTLYKNRNSISKTKFDESAFSSKSHKTRQWSKDRILAKKLDFGSNTQQNNFNHKFQSDTPHEKMKIDHYLHQNDYNYRATHPTLNPSMHSNTLKSSLESLAKQLKYLTLNEHENFQKQINAFRTQLKYSQKHQYSHTTPDPDLIEILELIGRNIERVNQIFSQKPHTGMEEAIEDNKWLISNLQTIMKENIVLRRMVGKDSKEINRKILIN